jgi:hypothetical protein
MRVMKNSKVKLVNDLTTQKRGEKAIGFYSTKKVVGNADRVMALKRMGITEEVKKPMFGKIVMMGGIPHKMVNGNLVPLKKVI